MHGSLGALLSHPPALTFSRRTAGTIRVCDMADESNLYVMGETLAVRTICLLGMWDRWRGTTCVTREPISCWGMGVRPLLTSHVWTAHRLDD